MKRHLLCLAVVAACGPKATFRLTSDDNDRSALTAALAHRSVSAQRTPVNAAHKPRVFIAIGGEQKQIVAYDLAASAPLWSVPAELGSRVAVGGDFIVELEGKQLVARDQARGAVRWNIAAPGKLVGVAADGERAYATWQAGNRWQLDAYDGATGAQLWKADAEGQLGAPTAQGGLVYSPYLTQWLSLLDAKTGRQLARIRNSEDQIAVVRTTSQNTFYGSHHGVYKLDARSANGTRAGGTYAKVTLPAQLERASYGRDMYDPVQLGYTASDRASVLFAAAPSEAGALEFENQLYAIHYFRYVLGFRSDGALAWAYSHPRVELVASEHTGAAILAIAGNGELVALDPKTGAVTATAKIDAKGPVLGATFDADGWAPPAGTAAAGDTTAALVAIVKDRDARFDHVKALAVTALEHAEGENVTKSLMALLADPRITQKLKDQVAVVLAARKDPTELPVLVEKLAVHDDYIANVEVESLGPVVKAISGLGGTRLDPKLVPGALAALRNHLDAPSTQLPDLILVIEAMAAIGVGGERSALASHLLLYHADTDLADDQTWCKAISHALYLHGGAAERALLKQVAADPRTRPELAAAIADASK